MAGVGCLKMNNTWEKNDRHEFLDALQAEVLSV
jgi:hypothetical protein